MSGNLERLRKGERWWAAEGVLRAGGLILLAAGCRAIVLAQALVSAPPQHAATLAEFAVCAAAFASLSCGLALAIVGPGLLRQIPIPARSAYFSRT